MKDYPIIAPADPRATYLAAETEINDALQRVLRSGTYILGPEVSAFELELAHFLGANGAVGVANGTDALELALRACGVGPGDKVATVANTVTATITAIVSTGAQPVFVEIESDTMLMSSSALSQRLLAPDAASIKAVVPVHLYGLACDMPAIMDIARRHGLHVVEDCAQAHGSTIAGRMAGTWGDLAAFSFYPTKNLGALGDAGAVVGGRSEFLDHCRRLRQYGWRTRYVSEEHGRNSRLDEMQAAILRVRLGRLTTENAHRQLLAARYLTGLASTRLRLPVTTADRTHTWHQFVIRTPRRDELKAYLEKLGILAGVLYPVPIHRQPAYAQEVDLPLTDQACAEVVSLPLHPGLGRGEIDRVVQAVCGFRN